MSGRALEALGQEIARCTLCPRLVQWREEVGRTKRAAYRNETYWARPVPGFGDPGARVVLVGLAPGNHGANRTGRMFTGDGSAAFLYEALHATGFASHPYSVSRDDGLVLRGAWLTAAGRCAPPGNRPAPAELRACAPWLDREIALLPAARVFVALGRVAWDAVLAHARRTTLPAGERLPATPAFAHAARRALPGGRWLLGSFHPSLQNTNTGRLTQPMLRRVLRAARRLAGGPRA